MQPINDRIRRKFLVRYFLNVCLITIVPVALLGSLFLFFINNYISDEIESSNRYLLKQTAQINKLIFQTFDTINLMISSDINLINSLTRVTRGDSSFSADDISNVNALHNTLGSMIGSTQYIDSVNIYMKGASAYYSSRNTFSRMTAGDRYAWMEEIGGSADSNLRIHAGEAETDSGGRRIFSVYRNLFNVSGIAVVNIDLESLRSDMAQFTYYEGQDIYISDGAHSIALTGGQKAVPPEVAAYALKEPGIYRADIGGIKCMVAAENMARTDWKFIVLTPVRSLYGLQHRLTAITLAIIAFCFVLGIAIAIRTEAANYRSVIRILNAVEMAEEGKELPLDDSRQDVYAYILNKVIQNNILRNYMDIQISRKKYMMEMLELKALQYQINPHFLVNTLKTIYWKDVEINGMDAPVCRMMENLLDITGYSLSDSSGLVSLKEEIMHARSFADILVARHPSELGIEWVYGQEVEAARCNKLILQPYIENAFYHGIRPSRRRPGKISVHISVEDGITAIAVEDNGAGMAPEKLETIRASLGMKDIPDQHIGIYNPHRRIVLTFGEGGGNGVSVSSVPGEGTRVDIRFPFISAEG